MGLLSPSKNRRRVDTATRRADTLEVARKAGHAASFVLAACVGVFAAFGIATLGKRYLATTGDFAIRDIRFTGLSRTSSSVLMRMGGLARGQNLLTADLEEAERRIARHPWVRSVYVSSELPHTLHVDVREWEPAAIVDLGHLYLLSNDAQVFRRVGPGDDMDLPLITGIDRAAYMARHEDVEPALRDALEAIEAYARCPISGREPLSEVHVDAGEGVSLRLGKDTLTVKLGATPFDEKLSRLARLMTELERGNARAQVIHLENRSRPGWVAVRFSDPGVYGPGR